MSARHAVAGLLCCVVWPGCSPNAENFKAARQSGSNVAFEDVFGEFTSILSKLQNLQQRHRAADPADQPRIEREFDLLVQNGRDVAERLLAAAKTAYRSAPDTNSRAGELLYAVLVDADANDRYEEAAVLAGLLRENNFVGKGLHNLSGIAAFCTHDFALAREELEQAARAKAIDTRGQEYSTLVNEYAQHWETEQKLRAAEAEADDLPRVRLTTTKGDIVVELFENEAPIATANFIYLVEKHLYDGTLFHRVISNFMAQGGDPDGTGQGGPGYTIPCECYRRDRRQHFAGSLSMANAGPNTGGSQFFLTYVPTHRSNGSHTVFGRVIEGMDVLANLTRTEPQPTGLPDKIVEAIVLRKRDHEYDPPKVPVVDASP